MLMRYTKQLLSLTAVVLLAACTDNSLTNPFQNAVGTYQLTVFAGKTIPATYTIQPGDPNYPNGATFVVTGGSMQLNSNGTFVETNNFVTTPSGQAGQPSTFISSGTWTMQGTTTLFLTAPPQNGNVARDIQATLDLDTINFQESDGAGGFDSFEYKR
jgi:hypothetical protein